MSWGGASLNSDVLSFSKNAIKATTYLDDYIIQGFVFSLSAVQTLNASATINFLLTPISTGYSVIMPPFDIKSSATYVKILIYEDTNYTGGTAVTSLINRNRTSTNTFKSTLTTGATGASKGNLLITHAIFASDSPAGSAVSASAGSSIPLILSPAKKYLVEIANQEAVTTNIEIDVLIPEIPNDN